MTDFEKIEQTLIASGKKKDEEYTVFCYDTLGVMGITMYQKVYTNHFSFEVVETTFEFDFEGNLKEIY